MGRCRPCLPRIPRNSPFNRNKRVRTFVLYQFPQGTCIVIVRSELAALLVVQWGLTNFDLSTLWVRDRKHLTDALDITPPFLRSQHSDSGKKTLLSCR